MVDAVVSQVVQRLGDIVIGEVIFLRGVRKEVQRLRDELKYMQRFLQHAEDRQYGDATIRVWVSDIRDFAYDIEDVLDAFHLNKLPKRSGRIASMCCCIFDKCKETVILHNIGKKIEEFKNRINDLSRRRQQYGLQDSGNGGEGTSKALGRLKEVRRATSFAVEEKVVGFDDDARDLLSKLLDNDPRRFVISIYGMGGLGKTTLARNLYHNSDVKMRFKDCCAWVSVSQDYTTQDLLVRIIKSFGFMTEDLEKMKEEDLGRYLQESLQKRSYLVVIDDVWDKEAWKSLKRAFPDNKNRSRVIMTTRNKEVAERSDERTRAHKLRYLRSDESWQLFSEKAFRDFNVDEELEKLGREMVKKCGGLPLAIIVLGGLLSTKQPQEWHTVRSNLWRYLREDSIEISYLLALSFEDLPYQLKQCFLYLGLFPEDFSINFEKLIFLLVAEDFIPQDKDRIMEEIAKDYLDKLINRSLIQVEKRIWGKIETCRVHDLLRDLAIERAKDLNFLYIYDEVNYSNISSIISSCPRQAIYSMKETLLWLQKSNPRLRSLFLFSKKGEKSVTKDQELATICRTFSSLRVLYIPSPISRTWKFDKKAGKSIHLKYLELNETNLDNSLIFNLRRLQTLVAYSSSSVSLPFDISRLQELRHLIGRFEVGFGWSISNLTKLQTLRYVSFKIWAQIKTENLVNLRELWVQYTSGEKVVFCFDSIANLKSLRKLVFKILYSDEYLPSLQPLSNCRHLIDLRLWGRIEKLPEDIHQVLPNLECLSLIHSQLKHDPMPMLEKLPNLTVLNLDEGFYKGEKMVCSAKGFPRLEILLIDLYLNRETREWQVEEGALPRLRGLTISPYGFNFIYPERFESLPSIAREEFDASFNGFFDI
ncbi:hypothetical protein ACOSP7_017481 [Xanthoceras sorbifolium]